MTVASKSSAKNGLFANNAASDPFKTSNTSSILSTISVRGCKKHGGYIPRFAKYRVDC